MKYYIFISNTLKCNFLCNFSNFQWYIFMAHKTQTKFEIIYNFLLFKEMQWQCFDLQFYFQINYLNLKFIISGFQSTKCNLQQWWLQQEYQVRVYKLCFSFLVNWLPKKSNTPCCLSARGRIKCSRFCRIIKKRFLISWKFIMRNSSSRGPF